MACLLVISLAALLGLAARRYWESARPRLVAGNYAGQFDAGDAAVILYATKDCQFCAQTRQYLRERNIRFSERLLDSPGVNADRARQLQVRGVPIVLTQDRMLVGFFPEELDRMMPRLAARP